MRANASFWRTWPGACAIALLAVLLFFLVTEHTAHFFGFLPYGFLLLCPLMHLFMHHGHGSHGGDDGHENKNDAGPAGGHHH
jgi:hypothetical protein